MPKRKGLPEKAKSGLLVRRSVVFDESVAVPTSREIASNATDIFLNQFVFGAGKLDAGRTYPHPDDVLRFESRGRFYELYEQMEHTDPHYYAVLDTRKNAVLGKPWTVIPNEHDPRAEEHAQFITLVLENIPQFKSALYELMDAMGKGWKAAEIMWDVQELAGLESPGPKVVVGEIKGRPQRRFVFDMDNKLKVLRDEEQTTFGVMIDPSVIGAHVPKNKFIVTQFNVKNNSPYGNGLARKCYWYYWFKKSVIKYSMVYADKFGQPTIIGKYGVGMSSPDQDHFREVLQDLQQEAVLTVPEGTEIDLLEANRTSTGNIYHDLLNFFDDAMSKAVLGQTLSSTEGRRSGSLALGEVHADVKQDVLEKDESWLSGVIDLQLIRPLIDFNFAGVVGYPRIRFDVQQKENQAERATTFSTLKNLGMSLSKAQMQEEFKLKEPVDAEDVIPGGFGITGEQPFDVAEDQAGGGGGGGFGGPKPPKPTGGSKPPTGDDDSKNTKFSEIEMPEQSLDQLIPGATAAGLTDHSRVNRGLRRLLRSAWFVRGAKEP